MLIENSIISQLNSFHLMNDELIAKLKQEEQAANISGWDFSHIEGKCKFFYEEIPWDYEKIVKSYLKDNLRILDIDTGGGEMLLTFHHPYSMTSATESYPASVELCKKKLIPLGIDFHEASNYSSLPFDNESFDIILNRHGSYEPVEVKRLLKPGGIFITQQVGGNNNIELRRLLCPNAKYDFADHLLKNELPKFINAGLKVIQSDECYFKSEFYDLPALIWFARVINHEFVGFSVDSNQEQILAAQKILKRDGKITSSNHRFFIVAQK